MIKHLILITITSFVARFSQFINLFPNNKADCATYMSVGKAVAKWGILSKEMLQNFPLQTHPIYPSMLGIIYSFFGDNPLVVLFIQSAIGAGLCILIYLITKEIFNQNVALIAGLISCFYPIFVKISNMLLSEQLFVAFFMLSFFLFIKYLRKEKLIFLIFSAVILGVATLTRSVSIFFIVFLSVFLFIIKKRIQKKIIIIRICLFFLFFTVIILPWTIRNYYVSGGSIIPITEAPDRGIYCSFKFYNNKIAGIRPDDDPVMVKARSIESFKERRKYFFSETIKLIRNNPKAIFKLQLLKIAYLWSPISWEILGDGEARYNYGYVFILPFFIYGAVLLVRRKSLEELLLFLPIIYFQCIHLIYFGLPRFRFGFEPILIIIASFGIYSLFRKIKNKNIFITSLVIFFIFNYFLFLHSLQTKNFLKAICVKIGLW